MESVAGTAIIRATGRAAVVEPGVDITDATIVMVTPYDNMRGDSYWVTRNPDEDFFVIRVNGRRNNPREFAWMVIEPDATSDAAPAAAEGG